MKNIIIATRKSPLALKQAEVVKDQLVSFYPNLTVEILGLTTTADEKLDVNLTQIGGKGLFVKELEEALLDRRADIAVHSMKDVPMQLPKGLMIAAMMKRADARDVFVANEYSSLEALPEGAKVGTSSLRRQMQLCHHFPHLAYEHIRGNIQTRLNRLDRGDFAALILAAAGLIRMSLDERIKTFLEPSVVLPAAGQGALGIECREDDHDVLALLKPIIDKETTDCVLAEREVCRLLEGGCQVPIGSYAEIKENKIYLRAVIPNKKGDLMIKSEGYEYDPIALAEKITNDLLAQGARKLLDEFK